MSKLFYSYSYLLFITFCFSPIPWLPTPPHLNQSSLINGTYTCTDNRSLSAVQSPDFNRSKRNQSSLDIDDNYHLYQVYQGDNLSKQSCLTSTHYGINGLQPTTSYQQQHSVRREEKKEIFLFEINLFRI